MMAAGTSWLMALVLAQSPIATPTPTAAQFAADAVTLDKNIGEYYAYPEKLPGGVLPQSPQLAAERAGVNDKQSLLHYAEDRVASLADHHAITGSSFKDSWAVVPTYADIWIERLGADFVVDAVREGSPAMRSGVRKGDHLTKADGLPIAEAVTKFWSELGLAVTQRRAEYAARVLAAGRRDRPRSLEFESINGARKALSLPSLYADDVQEAAIGVRREGPRTVIRIGNSLGDQSLIAQFDSVMAKVPAADRLTIDLQDTPSGGNTSVARAIMGWFVDRPRPFQMHNLPSEERETGIARQWVEQVLPRTGKHRRELPEVWVGRWTGSMGEGLAIGFAALGATVRGDRMAGLNGSVEDVTLPNSGLTIKLPTERLMTVTGEPREDFRPLPLH